MHNDAPPHSLGALVLPLQVQQLERQPVINLRLLLRVQVSTSDSDRILLDPSGKLYWQHFGRKALYRESRPGVPVRPKEPQATSSEPTSALDPLQLELCAEFVRQRLHQPLLRLLQYLARSLPDSCAKSNSRQYTLDLATQSAATVGIVIRVFSTLVFHTTFTAQQMMKGHPQIWDLCPDPINVALLREDPDVLPGLQRSYEQLSAAHGLYQIFQDSGGPYCTMVHAALIRVLREDSGSEGVINPPVARGNGSGRARLMGI